MYSQNKREFLLWEYNIFCHDSRYLVHYWGLLDSSLQPKMFFHYRCQSICERKVWQCNLYIGHFQGSTGVLSKKIAYTSIWDIYVRKSYQTIRSVEYYTLTDSPAQSRKQSINQRINQAINQCITCNQVPSIVIFLILFHCKKLPFGNKWWA